MPDKTTKDIILEKEKEALKHWSNGNISGYLLHAADNVTYMDDIGAHKRIDGKDSVLKYASQLEGKIPKHNFKVIHPKVQLNGETGILTLQYHPFSPEGDPLTPWKATVVYQHSDGDWQMIHAHWSMIKETN
jgi:ketosteroid isomerase-like protein